MADLPILFSGSMVRAILREIETPGTGKTQTRRILNPQPEGHVHRYGWSIEDGATWADDAGNHKLRIWAGDRLYVREQWRVAQKWDDHAPVKSKKGKPTLPARGMTVFFDAGGSIANQASGNWEPDNSHAGFPHWIGKNRQGMHMPKWASRLTLIVEDVKIERLQDCSDDDALAEGVEGTISALAGIDVDIDGEYWPGGPQRMYAALWDQINDPGAWKANPWVVAYTFRPILGNIDQIGGEDGG